MQEYLSVGDAAKRLGVVPATVKRMVRTGRLHPVARTVGGITLFDADEVERLSVERGEQADRNATRTKGGLHG